MRRRVTHSVGDEFADRTLFFWAMLGVVAQLHRFGRALAQPTDHPTLTLLADPPPTEGNEVLYAFLGIVSASCTARARRHIAIRNRAVRATTAPRPAGVARPRSLLV